jgi:hypothetical protein
MRYMLLEEKDGLSDGFAIRKRSRLVDDGPLFETSPSGGDIDDPLSMEDAIVGHLPAAPAADGNFYKQVRWRRLGGNQSPCMLALKAAPYMAWLKERIVAEPNWH